jgi:hypothetical protein
MIVHLFMNMCWYALPTGTFVDSAAHVQSRILIEHVGFVWDFLAAAPDLKDTEQLIMLGH